jgi:hypothetical protein
MLEQKLASFAFSRATIDGGNSGFSLMNMM